MIKTNAIFLFSFIIILNIYSIDKKDIGPIIDLDKLDDYFFGTSLVAKEPVQVISLYSGTVYETNEDKNNNRNIGKYVVISHKVKNKKIIFYIVYCLLSEIKIKKGISIKKGEDIGITGPSWPIKDKVKDNISVIIGIYTLTNDKELNKLAKTESGYMHNVYWYNPDEFKLDYNNVD